MLFDTRVSWSVLILGVLCLLFPFVADLKLPLYDGAIVRAVEHSHALLLLLFAVLSYFFMRPTQLQQGKSSSGFGQYCGGWSCLGAAPVGGVTISQMYRKFISVVFQWF